MAKVRAKTIAGARSAAAAGFALTIADTARVYEETPQGLVLRDILPTPEEDRGPRLLIHMGRAGLRH